MFDTIATDQEIETTVAAMKERNFEAIVLSTRVEALDKIKAMIPDGASVINGSSQTLQEIGYIDYLKSDHHDWENLHELILAEKDPAKQALLRKQATISDFYLGSVHGLSQTGEMVIASNTGSQLPSIVFNAMNLIFVVGAQKITQSLSDSLKRIDEYVFPLENERITKLYGSGTLHAKTLILQRENPKLGRKVTVLIVKEKLGY